MTVMTVKITHAGEHGEREPRPLSEAIWRGAALRCPACGKGHLFTSYLKVAPTCPNCGEVLHHHRADDAPPYFTIMIVGHIVIAGVLGVEQAFAPDYWVHLVLWLPLTLTLSLLILPRVKGALIGLQWAYRMHGFGDGPDPAAPEDAPRA